MVLGGLQIGAGTRTRTVDLLFTKQLLYQLSYAGNATIVAWALALVNQYKLCLLYTSRCV